MADFDVTFNLDEQTPVNADFSLGESQRIEADFSIDVKNGDHNLLFNRDLADQHPIKAITGLEDSLTSLSDDIIAEENRAKGVEQDLSNSIDSNYQTISSHISDKNNPHEVTKAQVGLGNVDNTSDINKPISEATQNALNGKVDKVNTASIVYGTDASGNQITYDSQTFGKVDDVQVGGVSVVTNKVAELGTMAGEDSSDYYTSVQVDTALASKQDVISDISTIRSNAQDGKTAYTTIQSYGNIVTHNVNEFASAQQGSLADTALQPNDNVSELVNDVGYITSSSLPTVNNGTLDIQVNGTSIGTFTANQAGNTTANIVVPDSATWGNITGDLSNQTDLQDALDDKQDVLTAGTNISIENNVISSTAQESFFRGNFNEWSDVPTDTSLYQEDIHGNRVPKDTDFIIVEDASQFVPSGSLMHKLVVENLHTAGEGFTIRITDENGVSQKYYYAPYARQFVAIDDYYSLRYDPGSPGIWSIKTNNGSPIIIKGTTYSSGQAQLCLTTEPATPFDVGMPPSEGQYTGAWRFAYYGVWATDGITGWTPQYKIENTLPIADENTLGIAKLYTSTGNNTDGSMTQGSITTALNAKQDTLTAGTNIAIENNVISSTAYESFFRGKYTDWGNTPTDASAYLEDFHGNTTPLKNDYIVVTDASAYVNPDFSDDPENVAFQRSQSAFTINIIVGNNTISVYYSEIANSYKTIRELFTSKGYTNIGCEWLKLKYTLGSPGQWYITSTSSYFENNELISANTDHFLMNTNEPVTSMFYLSRDAGVAPIALFGGWRFRYVSEWSNKGKNGWKPEYQVEDVLPIASSTVAGIMKLYTGLGTNGDGTISQSGLNNIFLTKVTANADITGATHTKITYDNKGLVTAGADITLSDVTDITATAAEVNVLNGITASTTELNYVNGVTSSIQTQIDGKQSKSSSTYNMGNSTGGWTAMSTAQQNALNSGATTTNIGQISTNTTNIANEIIDRQNADNVLQSQIDAIVAKSDVVDIVGTYAELQAYDTSGLGNNDVIKVISDSTHNDAPSYYRWVITGGVGAWVYIGSESETYTKSETDALLDGKQDVLTAGSNITISGNTISATDTTYTGSDGIILTGTNFTNSGVRSVSTGSTNGTISVNTNGTSVDVSVYGLGSAAYTASTSYATSSQGSLADTAVQPTDLATVATTGDYDDLTNKPTIPAAQVNSDWNAVSGVAEILNKPTLATVATSGAYSDLSGTPTIPTVNNATLTITQGGVNKGTFTANASSDVTISLDAGGGDVESVNGYTGVVVLAPSDLGITEYTANEVQTLWDSIS